MIATCPIHNTSMEEKSGQFGTYFSHKTADGYCNGKKITPFKNGNGNIQQPVANGTPSKTDAMLICNAANNATALVNAGTIPIDQWSAYFDKILAKLAGS